MSGNRLRALSTKVTGTLAPVVNQAAEGVVQLTDESLKFFVCQHICSSCPCDVDLRFLVDVPLCAVGIIDITRRLLPSRTSLPLTCYSCLQDYASAGDPITNLATDLERLSDKDDEDSFIDDGASDIENRAEIESDLQGHGFMAQFKPIIHRYKNWTRQMKRFCPAV
jgi:hypothetical protein